MTALYLFTPPIMGIGPILLARLVVLVLLADGAADQVIGVHQLLGQAVRDPEDRISGVLPTCPPNTYVTFALIL